MFLYIYIYIHIYIYLYIYIYTYIDERLSEHLSERLFPNTFRTPLRTPLPEYHFPKTPLLRTPLRRDGGTLGVRDGRVMPGYHHCRCVC